MHLRMATYTAPTAGLSLSCNYLNKKYIFVSSKSIGQNLALKKPEHVGPAADDHGNANALDKVDPSIFFF